MTNNVCASDSKTVPPKGPPAMIDPHASPEPFETPRTDVSEPYGINVAAQSKTCRRICSARSTS